MGKIFGRRSGEAGDTLIEVLVALVVAAILLTGLSVALLSSLKNAQFAQSQVKATRYAQEALDRIRSIRDRNDNIFFLDGSSRPFSYIFGSDICGVTSCYFSLNDANIPPFQEVSTPFVDLGDSGLSRQIYLQKNATDLKVTVQVRWKDAAGDHISNLQTILTSRW